MLCDIKTHELPKSNMYLISLEMRCMWLSRKLYARNIPIEHPTVVRHHGLIPQIPITLFYCSGVLVKHLTLLITNLSKVRRKKNSNVNAGNATLGTFGNQFFICCQQLFYTIFVLGIMIISQELPIENSTKLFFQFHL